jgi:hypothetical protein
VTGRFRSGLRLLSPREKFMLGAGVLAVVLFVAVRQFVFPRIDEYRKIRAEIPQRLRTLSRHEVVSKGESGVDEVLADRGERLFALEAGLLPGDSPAAAGAVLQGMLKPWAERSKLRLVSLRALPPATKGPYSEIAVSADLQGNTEGMAAFLAEIARQKRILRVRRLGIASGMYSQAMAARPELLTVTVEIAGMADAPPEAQAGTEGE